jgi:hypothetical protein
LLSLIWGITTGCLSYAPKGKLLAGVCLIIIGTEGLSQRRWTGAGWTVSSRQHSEAWLDDLGNKQVVIRGRGGVGKTVILLQMAYRAFDRERMRSLMLTYNKALVADMRRTMALLGVPRSVENGGICIDTVHAFIGRLMHGLGIIQDYTDFLEAYEQRKDLLLEYVRSKTVSPADISELIKRNPTDFLWEIVFVDEGQDWPANEIEILSEALRAGRLAAEGSREASVAIYSDLTLSEGGKAVKASETAYRLTNAALPNFDRAHEALQGEISRLKAKTNAPTPDTSTRSNFMASEIRQRLAGMDQTKRLAAITASISEGPAGDAVVEACLNAPSVLSGLSSTELEHIRLQWRAKRYPDEMKRIALLEKDAGHLARGGQIVVGWRAKCADQAIVAAAKPSNDAAQKAIASANAVH